MIDMHYSKLNTCLRNLYVYMLDFLLYHLSERCTPLQILLTMMKFARHPFFPKKIMTNFGEIRTGYTKWSTNIYLNHVTSKFLCKLLE